MQMPRRSWTMDEKFRLVAMRDGQGHSWKVIASAFPGATAQTCQSQYCNMKDKREDRARRKPTDSLASAAQLEDRARRTALRQMREDITAVFFGDPLPGYSELDTRRARQAPAPRSDRRAVQLGPRPTLYWGKIQPEQVRA